jgi:hypothetical protein
MMVLTVIMVGMVSVTTVGTAFGLEGSPHHYKIRSEAMEHTLDHMVRPNEKKPASNFSREMPISQMPSEAHELVGIFMSDLDNQLCSGSNL